MRQVDPASYLTDSAAAQTVEAVCSACVAAGEPDPLDEAARLLLKHQGLTSASLWIADDIGFALVRDGVLDLAVAPLARERGVGTDLAVAALSAVPVESAWAHGDHPAAGRLAARLGFERARELWVMRRAAGSPLPALPAREDVVVRGFLPSDAEALLRVNAAAFASHPEQGAMDAADLSARMAEPWFDPAGLLLAVDAESGTESGALLGFHWTKRHSASLGEVYVVGVAPGAQGRGLGRLLTLVGLHHLTDQGVAEILLYVESDNHPAVELYSSLGFTHHALDTHVMYRSSDPIGG
ncbi:MAG: mycothiol synthase [Nocardioides sp.]|uniref:mycothiol synthase n=1 Tax=Nocardioides sp. TaxID=35761 RepID=UPI0039E3BB6D